MYHYQVADVENRNGSTSPVIVLRDERLANAKNRNNPEATYYTSNERYNAGREVDSKVLKTLTKI